MNEELTFSAEPAPAPGSHRHSWTVLIVDDEKEVHTVTELALNDFEFAGRGLRFLHAYTAAEARALLHQHNDIALVLLDVVMETDIAGLELADHIRNGLKNRFVRIVLRTGQPGQAPELDVIHRYDINDYKNKTELTRNRLYTTVYTSLSTYRDLMALDANRRGLEKVIEASARIFELRSMDHFTQGVLEQLTALLFLDSDALMLHTAGVAAHAENILRIVAATGAFEGLVGRDARSVLPVGILERIQQARASDAPVYGPDYFAGHQGDRDVLIFYVGADIPLSMPDRRLIEMFYRNVGIARENLQLLQEAVQNKNV